MAKRNGGFIGQDGLNAPDEPTNVSGTAGDEQVSVSFTAPTDVGGTAVTGYAVTSNDGIGLVFPSILNASSSTSADISAQVPNLQGFDFSEDGTKLYALDSSDDIVYQYTLSTPWDVSSVTYDSKSFDVTAQDPDPSGVFVGDSGQRMYIIGNDSEVYQYDLGTPYDISTAVYDTLLDVSSQTSNGVGIDFKPDGTILYILGLAEDTVFQYTLGTAWDVSTGTYASKSLDVSSEDTLPLGVSLSKDGTKLAIAGNSSDTIYEYVLGTPYDLSTATYSSVSLSVSGQMTVPSDVRFSRDNDKMYVSTTTPPDSVYEYNVGYPTASPITVSGLTNGTSYTFRVWAINPFGWSSPSDASGGVTPVLPAWAMVAGFGTGTVNIDRYNINTAGNAADFGDLTVARNSGNVMSSTTRTVFSCGRDAGTVFFNVLDYVNPTSAGNATDFGDATYTKQFGAQFGSSTRGCVAGAEGPSQGDPWYQYYDVIDYITFATTGNAQDFGNLTQHTQVPTGFGSSTRGVRSTGNDRYSDAVNTMDYVTIASTGNATDFGDNTSTRYNAGGCSSSTRGLTAGGNSGAPSYTNLNVIDYVTIASTGNATDFGDLISMWGLNVRGASSETTATFMQLGVTVVSVTIATTGNATDFGDLTGTSSDAFMAGSNAHGGLS